MSAGGAFGAVANFILFSLGWTVVAKIFDVCVRSVNSLIGMPMDMYNTMGWLILIYCSGPFLFAIALGINYLVQCNSEASAEV